jgi:hypothetical protein
MSQLAFADLGMVAPNARRDRLGRIEQAIDWAPVAGLLAGLRHPGGRPPHEALAMFRAARSSGCSPGSRRLRHGAKRCRGLAANALRLDLVAIAYNLRRAADLAA